MFSREQTEQDSDDDNTQKLRIYKIRGKIYANHTLLYSFILLCLYSS